jgi:hypothetical protein
VTNAVTGNCPPPVKHVAGRYHPGIYGKALRYVLPAGIQPGRTIWIVGDGSEMPKTHTEICRRCGGSGNTNSAIPNIGRICPQCFGTGTADYIQIVKSRKRQILTCKTRIAECQKQIDEIESYERHRK